MMEQALMTLMESLPNLAIALLALLWASQRIDKLLDQQSRLVDQLIEMMRESRKLMANGYPCPPDPNNAAK
jgi:hypothetical protein